MQNVERVREVLKLAARDAKANRAANLSLVDQVLYTLLVSERQARGRREYMLALDYMLTYRVLKAAGSIQAAWSALNPPAAHGDSSTPNTPASNTGVTHTSAAVPLDYFTGGK